jgi:hypothetical protein
MLALVATSTVSLEPLMDLTNRKEELARNPRVAPRSDSPDLLVEQAALAPWPSDMKRPAERLGFWRRFHTALLRALAAWHT